MVSCGIFKQQGSAEIVAFFNVFISDNCPLKMSDAENPASVPVSEKVATINPTSFPGFSGRRENLGTRLRFFLFALLFGRSRALDSHWRFGDF